MPQSNSALVPARRRSRPPETVANILGALIAGLTLTAPFMAIARFSNSSSQSPSLHNPAFQAPELQNQLLKVPG